VQELEKRRNGSCRISFFKIFFFFDVDYFLVNLLQYCFCFDFFGPEACGILATRD